MPRRSSPSRIVNHFKIPYGVVINRWDINSKASKEIQEWSRNEFLGKISYDKKVINSIVNLEPVVLSDSKVVGEIKGIHKELNELMKDNFR